MVCWRLLEREAAWLPSWRELARVYQRLEARGEIRGGRFITGIPGEQFALPEAVAALRQARRRSADGKWLAIAATDPANLLGTLLPGEKVARVPGSRVLYRDGLAVAVLAGGEVRFLDVLPLHEQQEASRVLQRAVHAGMEPMEPQVPARAG